MSGLRLPMGRVVALLMFVSLLSAAGAVRASDEAAASAAAPTLQSAAKDSTRRQRARLVVTRPVEVSPDGAPTRARATLRATVKPVRAGRPVALQVKRKQGWRHVVTRDQHRGGRVWFNVRAVGKKGRVLRYRVKALPYRGLRVVRSRSVRSTRTSATTTTPTTTTTPPAGPLSNAPAQPAAIVYDSTAGAAAYARPGGLVVAGRDNYEDQVFKDVSAAGGTTLVYLDAIIDNSYGRYHQLLINNSVCGPATTRWPGNYRANDYGYLNDFRVGSVLQQKLPCVLHTMVRENPHMAGWFADDLGSRSWFPQINWSTFPDKQAYRDGAIALTRTFRSVADQHGLVFLVNGTWSANDGGGYPAANTHGNALADGGFVEHHDGQIGFFGPYACSDQWAAQSPVTRGTAFNYAVTSSPAGTREYVDSGCYAYVHQQSDYNTVPAPWGPFRATNLPSRVATP